MFSGVLLHELQDGDVLVSVMTHHVDEQAPQVVSFTSRNSRWSLFSSWASSRPS